MARICIIGGSGHWRYVLEGLAARRGKDVLVGLAPGSVSEDLGGLRAALKHAGLAPASYDNWCEMLDAERPEVVAINSHFGDHAQIAGECLHQNLHVFCEKPLATTLPDLERLHRTHVSSRGTLAAMFGIRYTPWFLTARRIVAEDRIGQVRLIQAQKSYRLGTRPAFFHHREQQGGLIPWVGSHAIDWLRWFSGAEFESVFASHSTQHNHEHGELEVSAQCQFRMQNEISAQVSLDYLRPHSAPSHDDDRLRIVGTKGCIDIRDSQVYVLEDNKEGLLVSPLDAARTIFADFLDRLDAGTPSQQDAQDAFAVTRACLLARLSADTGTLQHFQ